MKNLFRFKSVSEFHSYSNLPKPEHPLISLIDYSKVSYPTDVGEIKWIQDFYSIGLKMTKIATKQLLEKKLYKNLSIIRSKSSNKGFLYDSKFMKKNYKMFYMAYKNIRLLK